MAGRIAASTVPTLLDIRKSGFPWVWVHCEERDCHHCAPLALMPLVIRWGIEASSDLLRNRARCTACQHKGATLRLPSYVDAVTGWAMFPMTSDSHNLATPNPADIPAKLPWSGAPLGGHPGSLRRS